jgi:hypothetical protein
MKERGGFRRDIDAAVSPRPTLIVVVPALMEDIDVVRPALEGGESCVGQHVLGRCVGGVFLSAEQLVDHEAVLGVSWTGTHLSVSPDCLCSVQGRQHNSFLLDLLVLLHARGRIRGGGYTASSEASCAGRPCVVVSCWHLRVPGVVGLAEV